MNAHSRSLETRRGKIRFPAYIPVTTFGEKYPLDKLVRPYLPRLAPAVMVSYYYAKQMRSEDRPRIPMLVDSGGFVSLFQNAQVEKDSKLGRIIVKTEEGFEIIHPKDVLELQEQIADIAFTLDFPIPPGMDQPIAQLRQELTIANALWALDNRRRKDLPLYACVQAWDAISARYCAQAYAQSGFDGIAIGGLVPRAQNIDLVLSIIKAVKDEIDDLPIHVFGLGKPEIVQQLYKAGVDSVDSSSYLKLASSGQLWNRPDFQLKDPSPTDRLHLALVNLANASNHALPLSIAKLTFTTSAF